MDILLQDGEVYAGIIVGKNGDPNYHLVMLPQVAEDITWDKAMAWAAELGADLPTRREQALLFVNAAEHFVKSAYWSAEQCAGNPDHAWIQYFDDGYQYFFHKSYAGRARAVRRVTYG